MKLLFLLLGVTFLLNGCDTNAPVDVVISQTASKVYWADRSKAEIQSADLNGENIEKVVFGLFDLRDLDINETDGKIYFTDLSTSRILRVNTDGRQLEFVHELTSRPTDLALDELRGKLYWMQDFRVWRSNVDGSMPEIIIEPANSAEPLFQLSIDSDTGELFWLIIREGSDLFSVMKSDLDGNTTQEVISLNSRERDRVVGIDAPSRWIYVQKDRVLQRVHIDSQEVTELITLPEGAIYLHIDTENNQLYWVQNSEIWRTDLALGEASLFFTDSFQTSGFPLAVQGESVFWVRIGGQAIHRADLDGTNASQVIRFGLSAPEGSADFQDFDVTEDGNTLFAVYDAGRGSRLIRVDLSSGASSTLIAHDARPYSLAVDSERDGLFWGDVINHMLSRSRLDGSDAVELGMPTDILWPGDIKIDKTSLKIYWVEQAAFNNDPRIMRSNLDGTGIEQILGVSDGLEGPFSLALDTENARLYWTDRETNSIHSADLDGKNKVTLLTAIRDPVGIEVDPSNGHIYWAQSITGLPRSIRRADLNGMNVEVLVTEADDLNYPIDLELDLVQGHLYWAELEAAKIRRANLDGSEVVDILTAEDGLRSPWSLSLTLVQENQ